MQSEISSSGKGRENTKIHVSQDKTKSKKTQTLLGEESLTS